MDWLIFVALLLTSGPIAWGAPLECAELVVAGVNKAEQLPAPYAVSERTSQALNLEARGTLRVRGIATRYKDGALGLSVTPYVLGAGHALIAKFNEERFGSADQVDKQWAGELEFQGGVLVRANPTSGYFHTSEIPNDPLVLLDYLSAPGQPFKTHGDFELVAYRAESRHLDARLDAFLSKTSARDDQGFMHQVNNFMVPVLTYSEILSLLRPLSLGDEIQPAEYAANLAILEPAHWELVKLYPTLLNEDGAGIEALTEVELVEGCVKSGSPIPTMAFHKYFEGLSTLKKFSRMSGPRADNKEWWKPYGGLVRDFPLLKPQPKD